MKTIKTIVGISLICCMLFGLVLISLNMTGIRPTATNLAQQQMESGLKVSGLHAAIVIVGNADFKAHAISEGWLGNGSASNPYVIKEYVIIKPIGLGGVRIHDTNVHFIIENVSVYDAEPSAAFEFHNVTNGELRNNFGFNSTFSFVDLQDTILSGNIALNISGNAFSVTGSQNILFNNTVKNAYGYGAIGFTVTGSSNVLSNNTARDCEELGFALYGSDNSLSNNTAFFNKHGFYISGSDNTLTHNIARVNSQNGFHLQSCSLNTLIYNIATDNGDSGFLLDNTSHNILIYNIAINNGDKGFSLSNASQNILVRNTATNNNYGLHLVYSNYNTFGVNTLSPNADGCIWAFECVGNTFDGNTCEEESGVPGFNLAILIGMIAVISAVFFLRKNQCGHLNLY